MHDGKVLIHGTPTELINNPVAREHYLGERFRI
jgi:lipopolysaccharide export system ATP-binding protein